MKSLLIIFTKTSEPGKVKTRLAKKIGNKKALEIHNLLVEHTISATETLNMEKEVWFLGKIPENVVWDSKTFHKKQQHGTDLGERMQNAFAEGFKNGYEKIVLIGSDIYDLTEKDIRSAFERLKENDFVLGPAVDGGYYLLGMNVLETTIFKNKNWGNGSVLKETLADLKNKNITLLETRHDVDVYEDIKDVAFFQEFL